MNFDLITTIRFNWNVRLFIYMQWILLFLLKMLLDETILYYSYVYNLYVHLAIRYNIYDSYHLTINNLNIISTHIYHYPYLKYYLLSSYLFPILKNLGILDHFFDKINCFLIHWTLIVFLEY